MRGAPGRGRFHVFLRLDANVAGIPTVDSCSATLDS